MDPDPGGPKQSKFGSVSGSSTLIDLYLFFYPAKTRRGMNVFLLQVTTLVSSKSAQKQRKGRSKRAHVLVAAVEKATENFVEKGEIIAAENPEIRYREMLEAFFLLGNWQSFKSESKISCCFAT
jgi:hypothetical protein